MVFFFFFNFSLTIGKSFSNQYLDYNIHILNTCIKSHTNMSLSCRNNVAFMMKQMKILRLCILSTLKDSNIEWNVLRIRNCNLGLDNPKQSWCLILSVVDLQRWFRIGLVCMRMIDKSKLDWLYLGFIVLCLGQFIHLLGETLVKRQNCWIRLAPQHIFKHCHIWVHRGKVLQRICFKSNNSLIFKIVKYSWLKFFFWIFTS